jgi:hypothetical protein
MRAREKGFRVRVPLCPFRHCRPDPWTPAKTRKDEHKRARARVSCVSCPCTSAALPLLDKGSDAGGALSETCSMHTSPRSSIPGRAATARAQQATPRRRRHGSDASERARRRLCYSQRDRKTLFGFVDQQQARAVRVADAIGERERERERDERVPPARCGTRHRPPLPPCRTARPRAPKRHCARPPAARGCVLGASSSPALLCADSDLASRHRRLASIRDKTCFSQPHLRCCRLLGSCARRQHAGTAVEADLHAGRPCAQQAAAAAAARAQAAPRRCAACVAVASAARRRVRGELLHPTGTRLGPPRLARPGMASLCLSRAAAARKGSCRSSLAATQDKAHAAGQQHVRERSTGRRHGAVSLGFLPACRRRARDGCLRLQTHMARPVVAEQRDAATAVGLAASKMPPGLVGQTVVMRACPCGAATGCASWAFRGRSARAVHARG